MADSRGPLNEVAERIDAGFNRLSRLVFLPPLVPALMFVVFTTWGGLTNEGGGNFYMPVMMEAWAFLSGMAGWGAIHLLCLPFTLLVSRWFHGLVTGLCYAAAVALIASLGVMYSEFFGEMKPLAWQRGDERFPFVIRSLVMAPVAATIFIAFLIAVSGRIDSWRARAAWESPADWHRFHQRRRALQIDRAGARHTRGTCAHGRAIALSHGICGDDLAEGRDHS